MEETKKQHESFGMIDVSRHTGRSQYFGSDLEHSGGVSITINKAEKVNRLNTDWFHSKEELIRIELTHNQFIDAITSGMNTAGVPCTIKAFSGKKVEQIDHVEDKKELFSNNMKEAHNEYKKRIDDISGLLNGSLGKRKVDEIKHELKVLKSHIESNTNFVMECFNEAMDKTVIEAKHTIANYIDHKVHSLGIEGLRKELKISIEKE